jgi:hypothetical protein
MALMQDDRNQYVLPFEIGDVKLGVTLTIRMGKFTPFRMCQP